jgi:hypothetical protein
MHAYLLYLYWYKVSKRGQYTNYEWLAVYLTNIYQYKCNSYPAVFTNAYKYTPIWTRHKRIDHFYHMANPNVLPAN